MQKRYDHVVDGVKPSRIGWKLHRKASQRFYIQFAPGKIVKPHIVPFGKNFLIGIRGSSQKSIVGQAGWLIHTHPNLAGKEIISREKIMPDLVTVGGTGHVRHEDACFF
jgi:hypothetical protein